VHCDVHWTHELYERGEFAETIDTVIRNTDRVISILREVTGRDVPEKYFPYTPRCDCKGCFVPSDVEILDYHFPYVTFNCPCGDEERADIRKNEGKLPWRIEWAAKWKIFGVTCEPFGKDHAAAGGSYDSGVRLAREIFDIEPPHPVAYEFVQLKGKGQMHKSSGSVVTGIDALRITPAEVLNFMIIRYNPDRHIDYDSGLGILDSVDEYDRFERLYFQGDCNEVEEDLLRAYQLSQPNKVRSRMPVQVPYRHLVSVVQIADDMDSILKILKRTEHLAEMVEEDMELLSERVRYVKYWLNSFAPDMVRFSVLEETPELELDDDSRDFIRCTLDSIEAVEWEGDEIHNAVYECCKSGGLGAKRGFQTLYRLFIGKKSGPRLGHFLSTMDREFVLGRMRESLS
jgi:lysyl-tRNA synthetase class 1